MKTRKFKNVYNILTVIGDFADDPAFTRQSKLLHSLYIGGRHMMISTITSTQVWKAVSPVIRKNITDLYIFRLRNASDLESIIDEVSAVADKKTLLKLYKIATDPAYGFLYIKLNAKYKKDMFYMSLSKKLVVL